MDSDAIDLLAWLALLPAIGLTAFAVAQSARRRKPQWTEIGAAAAAVLVFFLLFLASADPLDPAKHTVRIFLNAVATFCFTLIVVALLIAMCIALFRRRTRLRGNILALAVLTFFTTVTIVLSCFQVSSLSYRWRFSSSLARYLALEDSLPRHHATSEALTLDGKAVIVDLNARAIANATFDGALGFGRFPLAHSPDEVRYVILVHHDSYKTGELIKPVSGAKIADRLHYYADCYSYDLHRRHASYIGRAEAEKEETLPTQQVAILLIKQHKQTTK